MVKPKKPSKKKIKFVEHPRASTVEFANREIGWLNFNRRVLSEAEDPRNPLLERLKFLSICHSNLDEFFMKRVGGLKRQISFGVSTRSSDGKTPQVQLKEIRDYVNKMLQDQTQVFANSLKPELDKEKIFLLKWKQLKPAERDYVQKYYLKNVFPVLTPLAVDPGHPFPFISNLSLSLGITLRAPQSEEKLFARVKIPQVLPSWIQLPSESNSDEHRYISLLEMIMANLSGLFPEMHVLGVMPFRLTRNADTSQDDEDAEDLLQQMEEELKQRRFAEVVRLEHGPNPDPWILQFLMQELEIQNDDIYEISEELDLSGLALISDLNLPHLHFEKWPSAVPAEFLDEDPNNFFQSIRKKDKLLHHPFESFSASIEKFIRIAADDPKVLAIKMTLYRTGDNSPFIKSLIKAAENGKQVVCLIELKARFDEQRNIYWAQALENAGVHVVYGIVGLKTHAKTILVVRQENEELKCYAHIGTGNYNVATAKFYTDVGLLTANEEITSDLVEFFHFLTGRSQKVNYKHLLVAPVNMFASFRKMVEREIDFARAGKPAQIIAKMNNLEENDISLALYSASMAGVQIELLVRGFCCLRPGVKPFSENIKVISTIGRYLEHSRIFYFRNGTADPIDGDFFIGSADWMYRNLHARVECVAPILDRDVKEKIWKILQTYQKDHRQTWDMKSDGSYTQRKSTDLGAQQLLMMAAVADKDKQVPQESEQ